VQPLELPKVKKNCAVKKRQFKKNMRTRTILYGDISEMFIAFLAGVFKDPKFWLKKSKRGCREGPERLCGRPFPKKRPNRSSTFTMIWTKKCKELATLAQELEKYNTAKQVFFKF
jgi:hypothetical protein